MVDEPYRLAHPTGTELATLTIRNEQRELT